VLPTDRPRNPFRRLSIYFGLAEDPRWSSMTTWTRCARVAELEARLAALEAARR
jgi:hypothetical protein